ncbi:MAG: SprT family zinc-dependent metalloprotease [Methylococcaceae bacterium]
MVSELQLGDLTIQVLKKDIKNVHLSVYPPNGRVKVSAPKSMPLDTLRVFVISKLTWIRKQQQKLQAQAREAARDYIERESHYFRGERYLLKIIEHNHSPKIVLDHQAITLYIRPNTLAEKRASILNDWYRGQLKQQIPELITKHEKLMGVSVKEFGVKKMKTKWGTCNPIAQRIWLNLELAKKPPELLEYVVVHEMVHLLERSHNRRFILLMDKFMPKWKFYKDELNRLPVSHVDWVN